MKDETLMDQQAAIDLMNAVAALLRLTTSESPTAQDIGDRGLKAIAGFTKRHSARTAKKAAAMQRKPKKPRK